MNYCHVKKDRECHGCLSLPSLNLNKSRMHISINSSISGLAYSVSCSEKKNIILPKK